MTGTKPIIPAIAAYVGTQNGVTIFRSESRSEPGTFHEPQIDFGTGVVGCDCKHFTEKCYRHFPKIADEQFHCAHLRAALLWSSREELMESAPAVTRPCHFCKRLNARFEMCDAGGHETIGFICAARIETIKLDRAAGNERDEFDCNGVSDLDFEDDDESDEPEFEAAELRGMMGQMCEASI